MDQELTESRGARRVGDEEHSLLNSYFLDFFNKSSCVDRFEVVLVKDVCYDDSNGSLAVDVDDDTVISSSVWGTGVRHYTY